MTIGSLFSGIGGLELGLEQGLEDCGIEATTVWQVERDTYASAILARHWPDAERFRDVREVGAAQLAPVDLICGGFPCQNISVAGRGEGVEEGTMSGLWSEFARILGELRPAVAVVENVPALLSRGFGAVLGDLAALGFDAEWHCFQAADVGAPHIRDRVWLMAYANGQRGGLGETTLPTGREAVELRAGWTSEHGLERVAYGLPSRMDSTRQRLLGNAVVPAAARLVGRWVGQSILDVYGGGN